MTKHKIDFFIVKSKFVCAGSPYFLGIAANKYEIRIGFIWWQVGVDWK